MTASPMTLKESRPAPPIDPATTVPELTPTPISKPPGRRLLTVRAISTAHWTARSAWLGTRSGAFQTASRPSPMNWSTWPRWRRDDRDDHLEQLVQPRRRSRSPRRCAECSVKSWTSQKTSETSTSWPVGVVVLADDVAGDLLVEVGAERLAQPLALGQAVDHLVEGRGELAELVGGGHRDVLVEAPLADPLGRRLEVLDRPQDRAAEQHGQLEADQEGDRQRDQHVQAQRLDAAAVGGQRGDGDAGDHVDQRQRAEQLDAQRDRRAASIRTGVSSAALMSNRIGRIASSSAR